MLDVGGRGVRSIDDVLRCPVRGKLRDIDASSLRTGDHVFVDIEVPLNLTEQPPVSTRQIKPPFHRSRCEVRERGLAEIDLIDFAFTLSQAKQNEHRLITPFVGPVRLRRQWWREANRPVDNRYRRTNSRLVRLQSNTVRIGHIRLLLVTRH